MGGGVTVGTAPVSEKRDCGSGHRMGGTHLRNPLLRVRNVERKERASGEKNYNCAHLHSGSSRLDMPSRSTLLSETRYLHVPTPGECTGNRVGFLPMKAA